MTEPTPRTGAVMFVGYHAATAGEVGALGHIYSRSGFADARLNGRSISETELNGLIARKRASRRDW